MRKEFRAKLNGDESRKDASAAFVLPFDTREVWGRAKVPVKVTINGYTWRSTVGNRGGQQYIVVNADARRNAAVKAGDVVTITLEPDTEKREIRIPSSLRKVLGAKLVQKLNGLSFTHKKEFIVWYSAAKKEDTRARRVEKMKRMLSAGKVISQNVTYADYGRPALGVPLPGAQLRPPRPLLNLVEPDASLEFRVSLGFRAPGRNPSGYRVFT